MPGPLPGSLADQAAPGRLRLDHSNPSSTLHSTHQSTRDSSPNTAVARQPNQQQQSLQSQPPSRSTTPFGKPHQSPASAASAASSLHSLTASRSPSASHTPRSSRDSSPAGVSFRQPSTSSTMSAVQPRRISKSRQNSSHEVSPNRPPSLNSPSTVPSAAAIQRALSGNIPTVPQLQPSHTSDPPSRIPRSQPNDTKITPS